MPTPWLSSSSPSAQEWTHHPILNYPPLPQHWSVLRAIHTLNTPPNYIRLRGGLSPIHSTHWCIVQGLMWGTRRPFLLEAAMVGNGCVGCCWPLEANVRLTYCQYSKYWVRGSNFFYFYVQTIHFCHLTRQLKREM
jgi:hypothetical protein